jgi:hypothetical protein
MMLPFDSWILGAIFFFAELLTFASWCIDTRQYPGVAALPAVLELFVGGEVRAEQRRLSITNATQRKQLVKVIWVPHSESKELWKQFEISLEPEFTLVGTYDLDVSITPLKPGTPVPVDKLYGLLFLQCYFSVCLLSCTALDF